MTDPFNTRSPILSTDTHSVAIMRCVLEYEVGPVEIIDGSYYFTHDNERRKIDEFNSRFDLDDILQSSEVVCSREEMAA